MHANDALTQRGRSHVSSANHKQKLFRVQKIAEAKYLSTVLN